MTPSSFRAALAGLFILLPCMPARAADDPRDSSSRYGVLEFLTWNHDWNHYQYDTPEKIERAIAMIKNAGAGFVRMDFSWNDLEPAEGKYDFTHQDEIVDLLAKNGLRIVAVLGYNAGWESPEWNGPPDPVKFARWARAVVRHYKGRVKYWEIWNEEDSAIYWKPQDELKTYTALLKQTYPALKAEDPTCQVLLGGLTNNAPFALRRIYKNGGRGFFDIINFHPYANPALPDAIKIVHGVYASVRGVMQDNGDIDKPIWLTEVGSPGIADPAQAKGWWAGKTPSEAQQADWVAAVVPTPLTWPGVQKVFWAYFRDIESFGNDVDHFGLLRRDFTPKPAYATYKNIAAGARR